MENPHVGNQTLLVLARRLTGWRSKPQTFAMRIHRVTFSKLTRIAVATAAVALVIVSPSDAAAKKKAVKRTPPTTTAKQTIPKQTTPSTAVQTTALPASTTTVALATTLATPTTPAAPKTLKFRELYFIQVSNVRNSAFLDGANPVSNSTVRLTGCNQEHTKICRRPKVEFEAQLQLGCLGKGIEDSDKTSANPPVFKACCGCYVVLTSPKLIVCIEAHALSFRYEGAQDLGWVSEHHGLHTKTTRRG
jgi:hypothetical protein